MADTKITGLQPPQAGYSIVPSTDVLPIVVVADPGMAASGSTRKATVNQILGSGGTATLASATITGALTIGGATSFPASVINTSGGNPVFTPTAATLFLYSGSSFLSIRNQANTQEIFNLTPAGVYTFGDGAGGTRMTLNSTGLGIGGAPTTGFLTVGSISNVSATTNALTILSQRANFSITSNGATDAAGTTINYSWANGGQGPLIFRNASIANVMTLDASGNVGVGVTPSAWNTSFRGIDISTGGAIAGSSDSVRLFSNSAFNTAGNNVYKNAAAAGRYDIQGNVHTWNISTNTPSVGGTITFSPAMTLDASGNLLVKKTALGTTDVGFQVESNGSVASTLSASTSATNTFICYSTGAAAYRFYVGLNGTINATNTTISAISDARFKENVQDIDVGLGAILALKPRKFDWKAGKGKDIKGDRGFIAQEFEQVFPQLVDEWADPAPEGEAPYKSVRQDLIPVLVKAIQELTARVAALEA